MHPQWTFLDGNDQPFEGSTEDLANWIADGMITPETPVWRDPFPDYVLASEVWAELTGAPLPPAPPPSSTGDTQGRPITQRLVKGKGILPPAPEPVVAADTSSEDEATYWQPEEIAAPAPAPSRRPAPPVGRSRPGVVPKGRPIRRSGRSSRATKSHAGKQNEGVGNATIIGLVVLAGVIGINLLGAHKRKKSTGDGAPVTLLSKAEALLKGTSAAGYGDTAEATAAATEFAKIAATLSAEVLADPAHKRPTGLQTKSSLASSAKAYTAYCHVHEKTIVFILSVPELKNLTSDVENVLAEVAFYAGSFVAQKSFPAVEQVMVATRGLSLYSRLGIGPKPSQEMLNSDAGDAYKPERLVKDGSDIISELEKVIKASEPKASLAPSDAKPGSTSTPQ